jgi:hypothetical protein
MAHKVITSKYNYNTHVFPIVRDRCAACHFAGGPAPMSLLTYKDAAPWAVSIREQLLAEAMPPWYGDTSGPSLIGGHTLTDHEMDVLMTWASGGAPEGDDAPAPAPPAPRTHDWPLGNPDMVVRMSAPHVLLAGTTEETFEFTATIEAPDTKWLKATDLLPGTVSMVHDATIQTSDGAVLASWVPGDSPVPAPDGAAFQLRKGASLRVRIHYKKNWRDENTAVSDQSAIGLYFARSPVDAIESLPIHAMRSGDAPMNTKLEADTRVLALRPQVDRSYASIAVDALTQAGTRTAILRLRAPRPGWNRRYWLANPIDLAKGTIIQITTAVDEADETPAIPGSAPLAISLDVIRK